MISGDASSPAANGHDFKLIGARVLHDESCNDLSTWLCNLNTGLNLQGGVHTISFLIQFFNEILQVPIHVHVCAYAIHRVQCCTG